MNERIVKLFMQSVDTNYIPLPIEDHIPLWTEKFAELIVQECANICYGFGESGDGYTCSAEVLEHFGVEE